jgi:hypothetical protein
MCAINCAGKYYIYNTKNDESVEVKNGDILKITWN